jgi:hypothetical protein
MLRRFMKKRLVLPLAAVSVLALAGGAYAYFSAQGTGTGSASVGKTTAFTVGETGTPTGGPLYPDAKIGTGNIQTDNYTVTNPGSGNENLNKVVISVATSTGGTWSSQADPSKPACTASDFSVGGQSAGQAWTDTSLAQDFGAGASHSGTVTVQMIDDGANQDNCQGVTVPLYFSAS